MVLEESPFFFLITQEKYCLCQLGLHHSPRAITPKFQFPLLLVVVGKKVAGNDVGMTLPVCIPFTSWVSQYLFAESGPAVSWVGSGKGNGSSPMVLSRGTTWHSEEQD